MALGGLCEGLTLAMMGQSRDEQRASPLELPIALTMASAAELDRLCSADIGKTEAVNSEPCRLVRADCRRDATTEFHFLR